MSWFPFVFDGKAKIENSGKTVSKRDPISSNEVLALATGKEVVSVYFELHIQALLFFADEKGSAGTDMTFFDFPGITKGVQGKNEISKTSCRVPTDGALDYWVKRFDKLQVTHAGIKEQFGKKALSFADFDEQQYQLISDELNKGIASGTPWPQGPVPLEYDITGLGPAR